MSDKSQRTEQPTQRRLQKAREEGRVPTAGQFLSAAQFGAAVYLLSTQGPAWLERLQATGRRLLTEAFARELTGSRIVALATDAAIVVFQPLLLAGAVLLVLTLALQLAVSRMGFSTAKLAPDLKRLNPVAKLQGLPGHNFPALVQALVLLPVCAAAIYYVTRQNLDAYLTLPLRATRAGAQHIVSSLDSLLFQAASVFVVFGFIDLFRQQRKYSAELRMTKQEIRDELKEMEGDPHVKAQVRRLRRQLLRRRMMQEVPKATAVIVNPTHFAVALKYDMNSMSAPVVVAKGKNYLALRIKQKAIEHNVPLVENPPLAQGLYKSAEVGQEIPAHLYRAVAEILAYIFRVARARAAGW